MFQVVLHYQSVSEPAVIKKLLSHISRSGDIIKRKPRCLTKNVSAEVVIETSRPLCMELYKDNKELGRFMLRSGGNTIAAGLVTQVSLQLVGLVRFHNKKLSNFQYIIIGFSRPFMIGGQPKISNIFDPCMKLLVYRFLCLFPLFFNFLLIFYVNFSQFFLMAEYSNPSGSKNCIQKSLCFMSYIMKPIQFLDSQSQYTRVRLFEICTLFFKICKKM